MTEAEVMTAGIRAALASIFEGLEGEGLARQVGILVRVMLEAAYGPESDVSRVQAAVLGLSLGELAFCDHTELAQSTLEGRS